MPFDIHPWDEIADDFQRGTVILGNGASIAVSPRFWYHSLLERAQERGLFTEDVRSLFESFDTADFELILRLVWHASNVNESLRIQDDRTRQVYLEVRDSLIEAVRDVHPEYDHVSNRLPSMYRFLKQFGTVLCLNYDLLVYWTMMYGASAPDQHLFKDCFLDGRFDDDWERFRRPYRERSNTLVFYPHGSLALCRNDVESEFKIHNAGGRLLDAILQEWRCERVVPLFVSEGTSRQKISSIQSSYYLSTVYREVLTSLRGTLTIFGWGIGDHDRHLLKRLQKSGIQRVACSVHRGSQRYCTHAYQAIQDELGNIPVEFFDSESTGWAIS